MEPWILSPRYQFQDVNHFAFLPQKRFRLIENCTTKSYHKATFWQARGTMPLWLIQAPLHFVFPDLQISVQPSVGPNGWKLATSCATGDFFKHIPTHVYCKLPWFFPPVSLFPGQKHRNGIRSRLSQSFHCDHVSPIAFRRLSLQLLPVKPSFNGALENVGKCHVLLKDLKKNI